ncbi:MAG: response regulator, partial [Proteobacteria bacterium]|nr:response regulator [Pseudomonadota bacterium]
MAINERSKGNILIVDDEDIILADLDNRLKRFGYTVCGQATTAESALKLAEQLRPDLVL